MKIKIIGTKPSSLYNFRFELLKILALIDDVTIYGLASNANEEEIAIINNLNTTCIDYPVSRSGLNPKEDFKTFKSLRDIFKVQQPNVILAYTIKAII